MSAGYFRALAPAATRRMENDSYQKRRILDNKAFKVSRSGTRQQNTLLSNENDVVARLHSHAREHGAIGAGARTHMNTKFINIHIQHVHA